MKNPQNSPAPDEVEISLFGPGRGECILIHLGQGDWMVVDSCVDTASRRPIALEYLSHLGVDVSEAVKLVVVTHWHDDHIRGASEVLRAAQSAEVICSEALRTPEFMLAVTTGERALMESPGIAEFATIFDILLQRAPEGARPESIGPNWATASKRLLWLRESGRTCQAEVHALSPSSGSYTLALNEIAQLLPQYGKPKRRAVTQTPNQVTVVLWVEVGDVRVLLGSDLEASPNPMVGWQAIVGSTTRPAGRAQIFKVPHHGSKDADSQAVWSQMLNASPYAMVTPFASGRRPLPSPGDIARLKGRTPDLYCTAPPAGWTPRKRPSAVEKTIKQVARDRRAIVGPMGHVRVRSKCTSPLRIGVDLFGSAYRA